MPLMKSKSKKAVGHNIKREMAAGKPQRQAVAVALNTQHKAGGGNPSYLAHDMPGFNHAAMKKGK